MNHRALITAMIVLASASVAWSKTVPQFQDGDRVCFVGDSITHGGAYHSYVYLYYLTRFPDREIRIWNKGISGERAQHVLRRFDQDVAAEKPTVCSVMLGMNDIGRLLYGPDKTSDSDRQVQQQEVDRYAENMTTLINKFDAIGSEIILITPSIYDQTAELNAHNNLGANNALGRCADFVKTAAVSRGQGVVDFYDAMGKVNTEIQRTDPSATIVGPDRVHPAWDPGHVMMGYQFLKAQAVPTFVSRIVLDAQGGAVVHADRASVSSIESNESGIRFTALESGLPFPQTKSMAKGLALVPFEEEMNQQILSVRNLTAGSYTLSMEGVSVGTWTAEELQDGVNLATNTKTPQFKQALNVKALNDRRGALQGRLRNAAHVFYSSGLSTSDVHFDDPEAVAAFLADKLKASIGKPWFDYLKKQYGNYAKIKAEESDIRKELNALHAELYQANRPAPHRFVLVRAGS